jgi:hypothetical protein
LNPSTPEAEAVVLQVQRQPGQQSETQSKKKTKQAGRIAQEVEHLHCKSEGPEFNPQTAGVGGRKREKKYFLFVCLF